MSKKNRRRTAPRPTVVFDFGGVLSAGHDPVPDLHELLGGGLETLRQALWAERPAYDAGACTAAEHWRAVGAAVGIQQLGETEVSEVQDADTRYVLRLDPAAGALIHALARNEVPLVLLSNASQAVGEAVRRVDWFEAFGFALLSAEEELVKSVRR